MGFLYITCECCKPAANDRFATLTPGRSPVVVEPNLALRLLMAECEVTWTDATRGAFRAQRRKDEVA